MTRDASTLPRSGAVAHNLPAHISSFLGRAQELDEVARLLDAARGVTLTGAPGIGKSRLAVEVARELAGGYRDGVWLVELAPLSQAALVPRAVASALSIPEVTGQSLEETIIARLHGRRLLLVLDNCEHLLGGCAELVEALLGGCPDVRIVATSREPLALAGERVWQVPPLSVPDADEAALPEALASYEAVRLFVERARAVQADFALNAYVAPAIVEICRRLDGIPLAIELAAARIESLTPAEIARRLDDRFDLLTAGGDSDLPRHQTLLAAVDWSHELLSASERALLRRLSVFVGGFELNAAEAICVGGEVEPGGVCDLLARLVSKSLVVGDAQSSPGARHQLLETIRAFAGEQLEGAGEAAWLRAAHARFYLALAERAEAELAGASQDQWLERLEAERANLRWALEWSLGHGEIEQALRLSGALVLYWRVRCHFSEGRELLDAVVSASEGAPPGPRAKAIWGAGFMTLMVGEIDAASALLEESLSRFRELDDHQGCARALFVLASCRQLRGDPAALSLLEESAVEARRAGDPWCLAHALAIAGFDYNSRYELSAARPLFEECLRVAREAEEKQGLRFGLLGLGSVALRQGDFRAAESLLEEAVAVTDELGEGYTKAIALESLGQLAIARGDYVGARELLDEALALLWEVGDRLTVADVLAGQAKVAHAEGDRRRARQLFEEALAQTESATPIPALRGLAELAAEEGGVVAARRLFEEALELARARGSKAGTAPALHGLGKLARSVGAAQRAAVLHDEALELWRGIGSAPRIADSLEAVGGLAAEGGRYEHAARLLGAASALRAENGYARPPWELLCYEADLALLRERLGEGFEAAFARGAELSLAEAVAQALPARGPRGRPTSGWSSLTEGEWRVAALVAEGLTNREIAARLFVSVGTVKFHLSHIFRKLGVKGRTQLARDVWRRAEEPPKRSDSPTG